MSPDANTRLYDRLAKPGYLYRPQQLVHRLHVGLQAQDDVTVRLPWGLSLEVSKDETVGSGIARTGIYELGVTETAWRLLSPADSALDVGANIGYFTSLFAARGSHVRAFEPQPALNALLTANVSRWGACGGRVAIDSRAVSDRIGTATLAMPIEFSRNRGTASLNEAGEGATVLEVATATLDDIIRGPIGLMKIDIEGHELAALRGGAAAFEAGLVRDVLFEELEALPSPVSKWLQAYGCTIFRIDQHLRGVRLVEPGVSAPPPTWYAPTYLATRDPARACGLMRPRGWRSLRPRRAPTRG